MKHLHHITPLFCSLQLAKSKWNTICIQEKDSSLLSFETFIFSSFNFPCFEYFLSECHKMYF